MKKRFFTTILAVAMLASVMILPLSVVAEEGYVTIRLHYHRPDGNYTGWEAWLWDVDGITNLVPPYSLTVDPVNGDAVCEFQVKTGTSRVGYIFRKDGWEHRDVGYDQHINITGVLSGTVDFYVEAGVPTQASYDDIPTREELVASGNLVLGGDVIIGTTIIAVTYKVSYTGNHELEVRLGGNVADSYKIEDFSVADSKGAAVSIKAIRQAGAYVYLTLGQEPDFFNSYSLTFQDESYAISLPEPEFVLGDVNCDFKVNMKDWVLLYDHISEVQTLSDAQLQRADVTKDGKVNMKDWTRLYNHISEVDSLEPTQVTLKVWVEPDIYESDWLSNRLAAFEKEHREYQITWVTEAITAYDAGAIIGKDQGSAADVFMYASELMGVLNEDGLLVQLDEKYANQVRNDNNSAMLQSVTYSDGEIYGFPAAPTTWFMYYNKSIFSETDIQSMETMLTKGLVAFDLANGWYNGCFFFGAGGTLFGDKGIDASAGVDFKGATGVAVARKMLQMYKTGNFVDGGNGADIALFQQGVAGAIFTGSWYYDELKNALGDDLGIAILPTFTVEGQRYQMKSFAYSRAFGVKNTLPSDKKELAMELAAFLTSEESQLELFECTGTTPAHKSLCDNTAVRNHPVASLELQVLNDCAIVQPSISAMSRYWAPMGTFGRGIIDGIITDENVGDMLMQALDSING